MKMRQTKNRRPSKWQTNPLSEKANVMRQPLPQLLATELNQLSAEVVVDVVVDSKEASRVSHLPHLDQNMLRLFPQSTSLLLKLSR